MPNIVEYTSEQALRGLQPSNLGVESEEMAGRRTGQFYHQIGEDVGGAIKSAGDAYVQHRNQQYIIQFGRSLTDLQQKQEQAWDTFAGAAASGQIDPNDHTKVDEFRQGLDAQYQKLIETAPDQQTRMFAQERVQALRQHMFEKTASDAAVLAGVATEVNLRQLEANLGSIVSNDLTSLDNAIGTRDAVVKAAVSQGNFGALESARLQADQQRAAGELTIAAIKGQMGRDPEHWETALQIPQAAKYLTPDQRTALEQYGQEKLRQKAEFDHTQQQWQRQGIEDQGRADYVTITNEANDLLRQGKPVTPEIITAMHDWGDKYGKYLPGENTSLQGLANQSITDASSLKFQQSDPRTLEQFNKRALIQPGQAGALSDADIDKAVYVDKTLNPEDGKHLHETLSHFNTPMVTETLRQLDQWMAHAIRPQLTQSTPFDPNSPSAADLLGTTRVDPKGDQAWADAMRYGHAVYYANIAAGLTPAQALDRMTSPNSTHVMTLQLPYWQNAKKAPDTAAFLGAHPLATVEGAKPDIPALVPAKAAAGESPSDYLRRIRGK